MSDKHLKIMAIKTEGLGYNNQLSGILKSVNAMYSENAHKQNNSMITAPDGTILHPHNYPNTKDFISAVNSTVDEYLSVYKTPDFLLLPYDHAHSETETADVDLLSHTLKSAFAKHGYHPKSLVLNSPLYKYKYIDLIHVGKHLLSDDEERKLADSAELQSKVIATLGVPTNMSKTSVKLAAQKPLYEKITSDYGSFKVLDGSMIFRPDYTSERRRKRRNILFSIGGKTEDNAIDFTVKDAENLLNAAQLFQQHGYSPIFANTPRTPSDVTDFIYEQCLRLDFDFFNNKKMAQTAKEQQNFRFYNGKYQEQFRLQRKKYGRIYPAILDVCEIVVNTHDSFSYTSDAAVIGLTSLVYTGNFIDEKRRYDCHKLFSLCHSEGYVLDLDEALQKLRNNEKITTEKMPDVNNQIITAMQKFLNL